MMMCMVRGRDGKNSFLLSRACISLTGQAKGLQAFTKRIGDKPLKRVASGDPFWGQIWKSGCRYLKQTAYLQRF